MIPYSPLQGPGQESVVRRPVSYHNSSTAPGLLFFFSLAHGFELLQPRLSCGQSVWGGFADVFFTDARAHGGKPSSSGNGVIRGIPNSRLGLDLESRLCQRQGDAHSAREKDESRCIRYLLVEPRREENKVDAGRAAK